MVDWLQLRLDPEELWGIKDRTVQVNIDSENEELANLHVDLRSAQGNLACQRDLRGNVLAGVYGRRYQFFKERGLDFRLASDYEMIGEELTLTLWASAWEMANLVI